jgi:RecB family exonuclease
MLCMAMPTTEEKLEALFAKVRTLPKARQELALEALSEIAEEEGYRLSDDERAVLEPALERARRGEFASDTEVEEVLDKPWS